VKSVSCVGRKQKLLQCRKARFAKNAIQEFQEKQAGLNIVRIAVVRGIQEQKENNIYRKSADELNEDWIEKIEKLKLGLPEKVKK